MQVLEGIRIVDFTRAVAGPYATRILADFGAQVIKVQCAKTANGAEDNTRGYFSAWNRNKKSITLDMAYPEARQLALQLIARSDIVVENFSARVMKNWRLDYEDLRKVKKDIIMLSMSAMGHTGPWKDQVAFGATVQALGGLTHLTAYDEAKPVGSGYAYGDTISGAYGAIAVLSALEHREQTGQGLHIDLSEYEVVCTTIGPELMAAAVDQNDKAKRAWGNSAGRRNAAPHGCYPCRGKDRWCVIAVFDEIQWTALCRVLANPLWTKEERFSSLANRMANADQLNGLIGQWTSSRMAEDIVADLQKAGIPAGVVKNARDLADDPHLQDRGFFTEIDHPLLGTVNTDTSPVRFESMNTPPLKSSPLLGQDNHHVFVELLGLTEDEFSEYLEKGVIG